MDLVLIADMKNASIVLPSSRNFRCNWLFIKRVRRVQKTCPSKRVQGAHSNIKYKVFHRSELPSSRESISSTFVRSLPGRNDVQQRHSGKSTAEYAIAFTGNLLDVLVGLGRSRRISIFTNFHGTRLPGLRVRQALCAS